MVSWNFYPSQDIGLHNSWHLSTMEKYTTINRISFHFFCNIFKVCFSFHTKLVYQERVTELIWSVQARNILNLPAEVLTF